MSFFGCIGYIMAGFGIEEVLELVYVKNVVLYIFSGKVVVRVIRGYFLVDVVLNVMFVLDIFSFFLLVILDEVNIEEELVVLQLSIDEDLELVKVFYNRLIENLDVSVEVCLLEVLD